MSSGSSTPATLLRDEDGNYVGLVLDGAVYRLQVEAKVPGTVVVSGPLTDTQLRATAVAISAAALPLPAGASTEATLAAVKAKTDNLDVALSTRAAEHTGAASPHAARLTDGTTFYKATTPSDTQPVSAATLPLPAGAASEATLSSVDASLDVALSTRATESTLATRAAESTLATRASESTLATRAADRTTAASPHAVRVSNGTAFIAPTTPTDTQPTSNASGTQVDGHSASIGSTSDADTVNTVIGRLKNWLSRIPAALVGGRFDINAGAWLGSTAPTVGQKTMAGSIPVTFASDQSTGNTKIEDGGGSGRLAAVDGANRLVVTANATIVPPASTAVEQSAISDLTGTADTTYVIPSGKVLTITRFAGGAEGNSGKVSKAELYADPAGTGAGMTLIRAMYLSGTNYEFGLDYKVTGDGTYAIRLRRARLDGAADEVAAFWSGYRDN